MVTAATIGVRRHAAAICKGLEPADGAEENGDPRAFDHHIIGAMAEFFVAKTMNMFWSPNIGATTKGDVGGFIEVRARRTHGTGLDLVIKPGDDDNRLYVLVHCAIPRFRIAGAIYGKDGKGHVAATWNEQRKIWFIPHGKLPSLIEILAQT